MPCYSVFKDDPGREKVKQEITNGVTDIFVSSQQSTDIAEMEPPFAAQVTVMLDPVRLIMEARR